MSVESGVFEVLATAGDMALGGDDFDRPSSTWSCARRASSRHRAGADPVALGRVKEEGEAARRRSRRSVDAAQPAVPGAQGRRAAPPRATITRTELETLARPLLDRLTAPCRQAMADAGLTVADIDEVPGRRHEPDARGQAAVEEDPRRKPTGANPTRSSRWARRRRAASCRASSTTSCWSTCPQSLGIETTAARSRIIQRNTTIPTRKSQMFSTAEDGQTSVEIHVLQGEREMAGFNKTLAKFQLVGIPPAPRGLPQLQVTFDIDANGIVSVAAKDLGTGNEQKIEVKSRLRPG